MKALNLKHELKKRIDLGAVDIPDRKASGQFGTKDPANCSVAIRQVKQTSSAATLIMAARDVRTQADHFAALSRHTALKIESTPANRELGITFNWHPVFQPEEANKARYCVLELLARMLRGTYRHARIKLPLESANFVVVPEIWSKDGNPMPLHFHVLIEIPPPALPWFDENIGRVWESVIRPQAVMGDVHIASILNKAALSQYVTKQLDIEWVYDRVMWPIDIHE